MKRLASSLVISLLLLSVFVFAFNVQPVKAPDTTIYINSNGSITPSTANMTRSNSVTYTFTGNNSLPIVVRRSNIILNGMGYTLQTSAQYAITVSGLTNVTIKNTKIRNNNWGIYLWSSSRCTISGNNLVSTNSTTNSTGIMLDTSCNYNVISGNNITGFGVTGIWLYYASNYNTISGNRLNKNGNNGQSLANGAIRFGGSTNTYGCSRNLITGNQVHGSVQAGFKIYWGSNYNTISYNNVSDGSDILEVWGCSSCKVLYNNVTNGIWNGIIIAFDSNITVIGNRASHVSGGGSGSYGIEVSDSTNITVSGCSSWANSGSGTHFYNTTNSRITGNNFTANGYIGIEIDSSSSITITSNNVQAHPTGIKLERNTRNSLVYHNNFINNILQTNVTSAGSGNTWNAAYPTGGNCWSDYTGVDLQRGTNQNLPGSDGIGDTAYVISGTNRDNYPLMSQYPPSGLSSIAISPSSVTMDVGQSRTFMPSVTGGSLPYAYQWYLNGSAIGGATSGSYTFTPSSPGHYDFYVNVTDGTNAKARSNTASATVNSALSVIISPSSVTMDVGQSQTFTSSVAGGTSPFSYRWYRDGARVSGATGTSYTYSPTSSGSHTIYVRVTDAASTPVTSRSSNSSITVNSALSVSISPSSVTLEVGQSATFSSSVSGGTSPYSYHWYLDASAVSGATLSSYTYTASASGSHTVYVRVTDSASTPLTVQSNSSSVAVNGGPLSVSISPSSATLDAGQSRTFTATASGGSGIYSSFDWYVDGLLQSGHASTFVYLAGSLGAHSITVTVTDSLGATAPLSSPASVTVNSALVAPNVISSPDTVDQGQTSVISNITAVTTGTGPYSYQWFEEAPGASAYVTIGGATSASYGFVTSESTTLGTWHFLLQVTDATAASVNSTAVTVLVNSALVAPIVTSSPGTVDQGQSSVLSNSTVISTGTKPYSYQWFEMSPGASGYSAIGGATSTSYTFVTSVSTTTGDWLFKLNVTDAKGVVVTSNAATVTVNLMPSVSITPASVTFDVSQSQLFTSTVSGGTTPYSYQWYLNGVAVLGETSATWLFTPSSTGYYAVYVNVTDAAGVTVMSNTAAVTVNSDALTLSPLSEWTIDPQYTNAQNVLKSGPSSLYLELEAENTTSKAVIYNPNVPKLSLSSYAYVDATITGTGNAKILLRFFLDDGTCFDVVYWGSPAMLNATRFDLSPYAGKSLSGLVYVGLMSSDGTKANITITQIAFSTQALPPTVPLSGWSEDPAYTDAPYVLKSNPSSLYLELDAENTTSKVTILNLNVPKLSLSSYTYVYAMATGTDNSRILLRFFLDDGTCFDVVYWQSPATLNATKFDLTPYAGRTLSGVVYVALMSSDGERANITVTEIAFSTQALPSTIPLAGWQEDSTYTNSPYALNSNPSSLYLQLDAENMTSKVVAFNPSIPKLSLSDYTYINVTVSGTGNARILLRFFLDDGTCLDVAYWGSPATLNTTKFDLTPYAGRTLSDVYVAVMSSDGNPANITITQIAFVHV